MSFFGLLARNYRAFNPPKTAKRTGALRFGILGAANIAPMAFILPATSHPDVVVAAVASRDKIKGETFAKKHGIAKVYHGADAYQQLLQDSSIDAVYNPLPNNLHYEWTMKALAAGKHVLLEKPSADRQKETREMFALAKSRGLVLLEAFHYRFHPAIQRVKTIIDSGELGNIKSIKVELCFPRGLFKADDIRFQFDLGGGGFMDAGCYVVSCVRYLTSANPILLQSATPTSIVRSDPRIDSGINAVLTFPGDILADITADLGLPPWGPFGLIPRLPRVGINVQCQGGSVCQSVFPAPHLFHSITVTPSLGKKRVEKHYVHPKGMGKGENWWTTYRYQLEAFVDSVRGQEPQTWMEPQDSIDNLEWVEKIYEKSGLGVRPASTWVMG